MTTTYGDLAASAGETVVEGHGKECWPDASQCALVFSERRITSYAWEGWWAEETKIDM